MKKILFVLAAACVTVATQAKILRVSNVDGSSAPYTTIAEADAAADEGDTIMVDASSTAYEDTELSGKRIVLIGPGYFLAENGITTNGASGASIGTLKVNGEGSVIKGMTITRLVLLSSKIVVTRCKLAGTLQLGSEDLTKPIEAENCIIHQNFFGAGTIATYNWYTTSFMQFTNNIFSLTMSFGNMTNAYIAYNTFAGGLQSQSVTNGTIEHNIASYINIGIGSPGTVETKNIKSEDYAKLDYTSKKLDKAYWELYQETQEGDYGAFADDDPYVLSGIPSGPVIQDLVVPASVEKGSTMSVTVKVGVSK